MNSRIETLLNTFGLEEHRVTDLVSANRVDMTFDNNIVQEVLFKKREEASKFVERAFGK